MVVYCALVALVFVVSLPQLVWPWIDAGEIDPSVPSPQEESA